MTDESAVELLFLAALDLPTAVERATLLDTACAGDAGLRREVERLLAAHGRAGDFLGEPVAAFDPPWPAGADDLDFLQPPSGSGSLGRVGRYEVQSVLGRGGFGTVVRAFDDSLRRVVAIKVLAAAQAASPDARRRFLREARAAARVGHENVVRVYEVCDAPRPYLVMEFVEGETLEQRVRAVGPLPPGEAAEVGRQIAEGLAAAHRTGLVHRDIKPANILLAAGPRPRVKIADFGLARAVDDAALTHPGSLAGTPMYMAPEQAAGGPIDHRADLFSLGSVLYAACSGRPPFRDAGTLAVLRRVADETPPPVRDLAPDVPPWLAGLIARLHAKNPADRFASAQAVADEFARRAASPAAVGRAPRSRRWAAVAAGLMALAGLGAGAVVRFHSPDGTLVVEVDDPGVSVRIDGPDLVIAGAGVKEVRVKPGPHAVEAVKDGQVVSRDLVTVERNGRRLVRVRREAAAAAPEDADRRVAEYVLSLGGEVQVNGGDPTILAAARLPRGPFRLTWVGLREKPYVRDTAAVDLDGGCRNLTLLVVYRSQVTDEWLTSFADCPDLRSLTVWQSPVGDAGVSRFRGCKKLLDLSLVFTRVTDAGLAGFTGCTELRKLELTGSPVSDAGLAAFAASKRLTVLNVSGPGVTDAGVAHFKDCPDLTELSLPSTRVTDAGLAAFAPCQGLQVLALHDTAVGDAGLTHFRDCRSLRTLQLHRTQVGDAGLAVVRGFPNLTSLTLRHTKVTEAGVDAVRTALPKCRIEWDGGVFDPRGGL